jgi:hypothetical protein
MLDSHCVSVLPPNSNCESVSLCSRNRIWTICHCRLTECSSSQFPTISDNSKGTRGIVRWGNILVQEGLVKLNRFSFAKNFTNVFDCYTLLRFCWHMLESCILCFGSYVTSCYLKACMDWSLQSFYLSVKIVKRFFISLLPESDISLLMQW